MLNRHLPDEVLRRHKPDRRMTVGNIIAVGVIAFILSGGLASLLPGAAYEQELAETRTQRESHWQIALGDGCRVDMPHGRKHCAHVTKTASIYMDGY